VPIVRTPVEGGEVQQILSPRGPFTYAVAADGIYFIPEPDPVRGYSIRFLVIATGKTKTIAEPGKLSCIDLTISPDRRWALYTQIDPTGSDLMLVENFK
jgi:hypothetical protein